VEIFSGEALEDLRTEFSLSNEDLDPDNPENVRLARTVLDAALAN
jgi:hypothetical protein